MERFLSQDRRREINKGETAREIGARHKVKRLQCAKLFILTFN